MTTDTTDFEPVAQTDMDDAKPLSATIANEASVEAGIVSSDEEAIPKSDG